MRRRSRPRSRPGGWAASRDRASRPARGRGGLPRAAGRAPRRARVRALLETPALAAVGPARARGQPAVAIAVHEVEGGAERHPDAEPYPGRPRAGPASRRGRPPRPRAPPATPWAPGRAAAGRGSLMRRASTPTQTTRNANSVPMFVRSYVSSSSRNGRAEGHHHAGEDGGDVRRAVLRVHGGEPRRQQAVAAHREEDARLAELEDEQHRRSSR